MQMPIRTRRCDEKRARRCDYKDATKPTRMKQPSVKSSRNDQDMKRTGIETIHK